MGSIEVRTRIEAPREVCFDLALDVDAHAESASFSREKLVSPGKLSGTLGLGDLVCFEGVHFGVRQRFCARITEVERPGRFVDEMTDGVFRWLRHVHEFAEMDGGTLMIDTLEWEAPLGFVGRLADAVFLESHMRSFVTRKQRRLAKMAVARKGDPSE